MLDKFAPLIVTVMVALICGFTIQGKPTQIASACDAVVAYAEKEKR